MCYHNIVIQGIRKNKETYWTIRKYIHLLNTIHLWWFGCLKLMICNLKEKILNICQAGIFISNYNLPYNFLLSYYYFITQKIFEKQWLWYLGYHIEYPIKITERAIAYFNRYGFANLKMKLSRSFLIHISTKSSNT